MSGRDTHEESGSFVASVPATSAASPPGPNETHDLDLPAVEVQSQRSTDESGFLRLGIRAVVTGLAAVGFLIAGFVVSPNEAKVPAARAGWIVLLTDKPAKHASVSLWAHLTPPTGATPEDRLLAAGDGWLSIEVEQSSASADGTDVNWALLLINFPEASFVNSDSSVHHNYRVTKLQRRPDVRDINSHDGSLNDYLVEQVEPDSFGSFDLAASNLAIASNSTYTNVLFPRVTTLTGLIGTPTSGGRIFDPLGTFTNAPRGAADNYIVADTVRNSASFPEVSVGELSLASGETPSSRNGTEWTWNNPTGPGATFKNFVTQDSNDQRLFWAGLLFGVAGGALVACALEVIDLVMARQRRRPPRVGHSITHT
jgi:hypothetical protein